MANNQSYNSQANLGSFVSSTFIWDIQQLQSVDIKSPEFKELLVRLYQNLNNVVLALNTKDTGYYSEQEILNGQIYFPTPGLNSLSSNQPEERQVFRTTINFGPLPVATSKSVPHNIEVDNGYSVTRIYGAATNSTQTSFIPLPFASPILNENIKLEATNTDIIITTGIDRSDYITTYVVIEYLKQQ